jgi:hypothetical protein
MSTAEDNTPYRSSSPDSAILTPEPLILQHRETLAAHQRESHFNTDNAHLDKLRKATQQEIDKYTRIEKFTRRVSENSLESQTAEVPELARIRDYRPSWWRKVKRALMKEKLKAIWKKVWNVLKEVNIKLGESRASGGGYAFAGGR